MYASKATANNVGGKVVPLHTHKAEDWVQIRDYPILTDLLGRVAEIQRVQMEMTRVYLGVR